LEDLPERMVGETKRHEQHLTFLGIPFTTELVRP